MICFVFIKRVYITKLFFLGQMLTEADVEICLTSNNICIYLSRKEVKCNCYIATNLILVVLYHYISQPAAYQIQYMPQALYIMVYIVFDMQLAEKCNEKTQKQLRW
jgi:hypothetical protein